jgi:serine/threonine protein phosphatase PrpC
MQETKQYIEGLFNQKNIVVSKNRVKMFEEFLLNESNISLVKQILENQKIMTDSWKLKNKIDDIIEKQVIIPNGMVNKPYETKLDFAAIEINDLSFLSITGLEQYGLLFDIDTDTIKGNPIQSGDFKIKMSFNIIGENEAIEPHIKYISLVINADPKSLWKDIPSLQTEDNYWKNDNVSDFQKIGEKHIVVASKRGRSHANVGSFRDDDFAFKYLENSGWSIVCVADGAGSAKLSRQGSKIACETVIDYFENNFNEDIQNQIDNIVNNYHKIISEKSETQNALIDEVFVKNSDIKEGNDVNINPEVDIDTNLALESTPLQLAQKEISNFLYQNLGKTAFEVHKKLEETANKLEVPLKDFHSTLIFTLFKKYEFGYTILTFGVGDCPIGVLNKDLSEIKLMNWLDVGEFGGGTRFITMPEIFTSNKFSTRLGFKLIEDFSYLILMTDGIYDPKFVVEANLEKIEKWKEFLLDLEGNNDEKIKVVFNSENKDIANQLSSWMDFWSPGNHDDRTLAVIF